MTEESFGDRLRRLRKERGLSQEKLSELSGVDREYISMMENGRTQGTSLKIAARLAKGLSVPPSALIGEGVPGESSASALSTIRAALEHLEVREVTVLGAVPAGVLFPEEQQVIRKISIPADWLKGSSNPDKVYALKVSGSSLEGDGIYDGDYVLIDPGAPFVQGKIYEVRDKDNQTCIRHVEKQNDHVRLYSSNREYKDMAATDIQIRGRMFHSFRDKDH